ncbi:MAG: glycosyltransferase family 4 protein [Flavobacteriaceae bacterium]
MPSDVLIISNYYPPESGAAPNRIHTLATSLAKRDYGVTLVCPFPNYPFGQIFNTHKGHFRSTHQEDGVTVHRLWLLASNSKNKFIRLLSMLSFAFHLFMFLLFKRTPDKVIIQCSPLFVGFFGVLICKLKRKKIILNVSDLWPLAGLEMGILHKGFYYSILEKIELFNYNNSDLLLGQSQEILDHFNVTVPHKNTFLYRNFPDFKIPIPQETSNSKNIKIVYAGLLGIAQGILNICKTIDLPEHIEFHIYGNGPEADSITNFISSKTNIFYHGSVSRKTLHKELASYHLTLIPLINRIYGSVPSKIFEYTRLGLPILYFSDGEGANIVKHYNLGVTVNSLDYSGLNQMLLDIKSGKVQLPEKAHLTKVAEDYFDFNTQFNECVQLLNTL